LKDLNVGIIGLGVMGELFAKLINQSKQAKLKALTDVAEEKVRHLAQEYRADWYTDYEKMLEDESLDVVYITTPEDVHLDPALKAIARKKHVFIEKPIAMTYRDGEQIVAAAEKAGICFMVGHVLRFDPRYIAIRDSIAAGELGDLIHIFSRRNNYISTGRHVGKRASVTFWIGIHEIDVVQWVTGLKVESVFARGVKKRLADLNMHDTIFTSAQFEKGTIGVFENSYALPQVQGERWSPSLYVTGTEGLLHLTPYQTGLRINKAENIGTIDPLYDMKGNVYGRITGVYQEETEHFLECVREGKTPIVSSREALHAVAVAEAIDQSLVLGREVTVAEIING
jgi:predicted dehydrogenase